MLPTILGSRHTVSSELHYISSLWRATPASIHHDSNQKKQETDGQELLKVFFAYESGICLRQTVRGGSTSSSNLQDKILK